jgi:hypothetical protein
MNIIPAQKVYPLLQKALARLREKARDTYGRKKTG